jgi:hypothetical protein
MTMKCVLRQWPVLLIPVFFLLNASNEYFGDLDLRFYLRMGGFLLLLLLVVGLGSALLFKNGEQALAFTMICLIYIVFTKNLFKALEPYMNRSLFFFLSALLLVGVFVVIRKLKTMRLLSFRKGAVFILTSLIIYETSALVIHSFSEKRLALEFRDKPALTSWKGGAKPNIYLLLFDEYQGNEGLKNLFGYENSSLLSFLEEKQFRVITRPRSNYNYTYFSVPSMFAMSYLYYTDEKYDLDYRRVIKAIRTLDDGNQFASFLANSGYDVRNYSLFDFGGIRTPYDFDGLDEDAYSVLFARTLPGWIKTDLLHTVPYNSVHRLARDLYFQFYDYNRSVLKDTKGVGGRAVAGPVFVYSHFLLPHLPVVTDSAGHMRNIGEAADELHHNSPDLKQSYLAYTKYANKICREIVEDVIERDAGAVIIMVSDHGLRRLLGSTWVHDIQMAVRMPGRRDPGFYDGMTSVNLLRLVLNSVAGQNLERLPDSVISVK